MPFGLALIPALLVAGLIIERCLALEARILSLPGGLDADGRTTVLVTTLLVAFIAFVGVAATVPGGLAQPGTSGIAGQPLPRRDLLVLAVGDAAVAFLFGIAPRPCGSRPCATPRGPRPLWRDRHRDRRRGLALRADPATDGAGTTDPDVLSLGRLPRGEPVPTPGRALALQTILLAVLGVAVIGLNLLIRE